MALLSWSDFKALAKRYGFDGTACSEVAKEAIKAALSSEPTEAAVTA